MPEKITSTTNPRIKHVVALRGRKRREQNGLTIVEGARETARALAAGVSFKEFYVCPELLDSGTFNKDISSLKVPVFETTKTVFSKISYGDRAEGVLAVCAPRSLFFKDLHSKTHPLYVIVERVEKPGNLGAILRTCDGAGVDGVFICDGKTDVYNPNVIRASLGAVFAQKVVVSSNEKTSEFLKSKKVTICAAAPRAKTVYTQTKLTDALAVVVGSEQDGLTDFWMKHADLKVKIPMQGAADSLNVSASTAILLYEIVRQRMVKSEARNPKSETNSKYK